MRRFALIAMLGGLTLAQSAPLTSRYEAVMDTGTLNAATVSLAPCPSYLPNGMEIAFLPAYSNSSTAPTLSVCGTSGTITKLGGTALASSDYVAGTIAIVRYNLPSTRWELQNPQSASAGSGTVTSMSAGALSPLFTTSVATPSSTPALSFTLSSAAQNSVFAGPATGGAGAPSYQTAPTISAANMTNFPTLNQNTTGNAGTATALASSPTQCSGTGSVALGIATSGNANCGYPSQSYVQASLTGSNVTMTSTTGTFYDGPSTGSIAAGTWFVSGYVTLGKASATGQSLDQCKLWDGTNTFATAETSVNYVTSAAVTYSVIHLNAVITESGSSTIKISCENSVASGIIYYQTPTSSLANASSISAVRIQ